VVSNPTQFLTPGMFGNMRLSSGATTPALLVPDAAVQTDQARKIVLVAGKDGSVTPRPVVLGPVVDGLRVIRSGLTIADKVVIAGGQLVLPGAKAQIRPGKIEPAPAAVADATAPAPLNGEATLVGN